MTGQHEIGALSFWQQIWTASASRLGRGFLVTFVLLQLFLQFTSRVLWDSLGWWAIFVVLAVYVVAIGVLVVVGRVRNPAPIVDFDAGVLRIGSEATPFDDVTEAWIAHVPSTHHDDLYFWFGGHRRRHAMVTLRGRRRVLNERDREVLAAMVERSGIQLPKARFDKFDPTGKFAWMDHPGFVTKEQAVEAILRTPASGDIVRA